MQNAQNKIIRFMLNAPWRFHVGANEFKHVGLLPIEYRVEQLMLGHMFNISNGNAPAYLISGINMNQHRYSHRRTGQHPFGGADRVLPEWIQWEGGGVVAEIFRDPYFVGWQNFVR